MEHQKQMFKTEKTTGHKISLKKWKIKMKKTEQKWNCPFVFFVAFILQENTKPKKKKINKAKSMQQNANEQIQFVFPICLCFLIVFFLLFCFCFLVILLICFLLFPVVLHFFSFFIFICRFLELTMVWRT